MDNNNALVLFSGGQDSTVCLYWALKHFVHVEAVCFHYGQRHASEIDAAQAIAATAGVPFRIIDASVMAGLSSNSLTDVSVPMDSEPAGKALPNTFVPGRNLLFISMAAVVARERNIANLVTGVSQADYSGYPDCRDDFIRALTVTLNRAMNQTFVIHTPLMWLDKAAVWQCADELGIFDLVKTQTVTCYNGLPGAGCGQCPSCKLRNHGLQKYEKIQEKYRKNTEKIREKYRDTSGILHNINNLLTNDLQDKYINNIDKIQKKYGKSFLKNSIQLLALIETNPYISSSVMAKELGVCISTVDKCLAGLKANNLLQRVGSNRDGRWKILIFN